MKNALGNENPCVFSVRSPFCRTLEDAGVPKSDKWWSLILYLRSLEHHDYLNDEQRHRIQELIISVLKNGDYSESCYQKCIETQEDVMSSPYRRKLQSALRESADLIQQFKDILVMRRRNIGELETKTVEALNHGASPEEAVSALREAFQTLAKVFEQDTANLEVIARTDALTGLFNRRGFDDYMDAKQAMFGNMESVMSMLIVDIDFFKKVNDTFGHRIGDQALQMVAGKIKETLQEASPEEFYAARLGGEEFCVALSNTGLKQAKVVAEQIRKRIQDYTFIIRNASGEIVHENIHITVSVGVAESRPDWKPVLKDKLIESSDYALYEAKNSGRNRVCAYNESQESAMCEAAPA